MYIQVSSQGVLMSDVMDDNIYVCICIYIHISIDVDRYIDVYIGVVAASVHVGRDGRQRAYHMNIVCMYT